MVIGRGSMKRLPYLGVVAATLAVVFVRVVRLPNTYSKAQWFFVYGYEVYRRALVGTLFSPLARHLSPQAANDVICVFSLAMLLGFFATVLGLADRLAKDDGARATTGIVVIAFATSPSVLYVVHCIGYFDGLLFSMGAAAIALVMRSSPGALAAAGVLGVLGVLTHEISLAIAWPAVALAVIARHLSGASRPRVVPLARDLALVALPGLLAFVAISVLSKPLAGERYAAFVEHLARSRVALPHENDSVLFVVSHDFQGNFDHVRGLWAGKPVGTFGRHFFAYAPFLVLATGHAIDRIRSAPAPRWRLVVVGVLFVAAACVPLALHVVAWDIDRINALTGLAAFLGIVAIASASADRDVPFEPHAVTVPLAIVAIVLQLSSSVELLDRRWIRALPQAVGELWTELRDHGPSLPFVPKRAVLFPNSDFERGDLTNWTPVGPAFTSQPTFGDNPLARGAYAIPEGVAWVGTYESSPRRGLRSGRTQGDEPTGSLVSVPFAVAGDRIAFLVGGGDVASMVFVVIEDDTGREVARFTGRRVEAMRQVVWDAHAFRGRRLRIRIVDASPMGWGHINADDFGYVRDDTEPRP